MVYGNVKKEKKEHSALMDLLRKHFGKDEEEMEDYDETMSSFMNPFSEMKGHRQNTDSSDNEYEGDEEMYEGNGDDDNYYEKLTDEEDEDSDEGERVDEEEEEDEMPKASKEQRKRMSIAVLGKKFSKPKRKAM